jgi:hypothetical protein
MKDLRHPLDKKADEIYAEDPFSLLKRDKEVVSGLKKKNAELTERVNTLLETNNRMVELVEVLDEKIRKLNDDFAKRYRYSYEDGGWIEIDGLRKRRIELERDPKVSITNINGQLEEIIRLLEKNKKKTNLLGDEKSDYSPLPPERGPSVRKPPAKAAPGKAKGRKPSIQEEAEGLAAIARKEKDAPIEDEEDEE